MNDIKLLQCPIKSLQIVVDEIDDYLSIHDSEYDGCVNEYFRIRDKLNMSDEDLIEFETIVSNIITHESIYSVLKAIQIYFSGKYTYPLTKAEIDSIIDTIPQSKPYAQLNQALTDIKTKFEKKFTEENSEIFFQLNEQEIIYRQYNARAIFRESIHIAKESDNIWNISDTTKER